jgi:hypothetical protein
MYAKTISPRLGDAKAAGADEGGVISRRPYIVNGTHVQIGSLDDGTPVFMDRLAHEAGGALVINRVKAHTSFHGTIESGLAKMCVVGLGKRHGAEIIHRTAVDGLRHLLAPMARVMIASGKILGGLAILEDAREQTADLVGLPPEEIGAAGEARLLERSKALMARLPFHQIDVLVVDELGKNISGTGMDTNVIGRLPIPGQPPGNPVPPSPPPAGGPGPHAGGWGNPVSPRPRPREGLALKQGYGETRFPPYPPPAWEGLGGLRPPRKYVHPVGVRREPHGRLD